MESCRPFYNDSVTPVCDQTIIPIRRKSVTCNATDPELELFGLYNMSIVFQLNGEGLDEGTGEGDLQVWLNALRSANVCMCSHAHKWPCRRAS